MTTFGDQVFQYGGVPVGNARQFDGWFDAKVFYADYDHGTEGAHGDSMSHPTKYLETAISNATSDDTIYVRPRDFATGTYGEDPQIIRPNTSTNFTITSKPNLSIIGTGKGLSHAAVHKAWIGGYSGTSSPVLTIYSPGCVIEGLRAQPGASGQAIFYSINSGTSTYDGGNTTIVNCDFHDANTAGAISLDSTWQMSIIGNRFVNCDKGIYIAAAYSAPQIFEISDNYFNAITTEVYADVSTAGSAYRLNIYRNYHAEGQPAGGSPNKYYSFAAASTGLIAGCYFGVNSTTEANLMTLNGVLQAGNHCMDGLVT